MRRFQAVSIVLALAVVLGATVFRNTIVRAAQALDATITNVDANGNVKVHEQGTANISGRVSVTNNPGVTVVNTAPLAVRDADNGVRQAFQQDAMLRPTPSGSAFLCGSFTPAPLGKRLVIEYASAHVNLPTDDRVLEANIGTTVNGMAVYHMLDFRAFNTSNGLSMNYFVAQQLRLYADPDESIALCLDHETGAGGSGSAAISGYFVDIP
jgi:hypothetical protein